MKPAAKLSFVVLFGLYFLPFLAMAVQPHIVVPCSGPDCDFCKLATLIDNVVQFILFYLALPFSIIALIAAGIILLTAGDNPNQIKQGKDIFKYTIIGLIIAFAAWLIVDTILRALLNASFGPWNEFPECHLIKK